MRRNGRTRATQEETDFSSTEVVPAPDARDMTSAEMRAALDGCIEGVDDWRDFEPAFGLSMESEADRPASVVVAERGDTKMLCRDGSAMLFGTSEVKGTTYLRGAVSWEEAYFGRHIPNVHRVTVQLPGGPEQEAVMRDGSWFLPFYESWDSAAYRAYDDRGELIYDSTTVDPDACYADPEGRQIVHYGVDENPDVEDCIRMLEWDY